MDKKVLVTGAGGFLGSYIVKDLLDKGYEVVGLARNRYPEIEDLGVKFIQCDLSKHEEVDALDLSEYLGVFHTAALAGVWGSYSTYESINYTGSKNLFDKCARDGIKHFIYTSSPSVVFGDDDIINGDESLSYPKKYYTHYAKTKAMAEKYILNNELGVKAISIRPHLIWGPGDPHLIPRVLEKAKKGRLKVVGDGNNLVDIVHVKNASNAHVLAFEALLEKNELHGNSYFIGQERPVNLWKFIDDVLSLKKMNQVDSQIDFKKAFYIGAFLEFIFKILGVEKPEPPMTRFVALQLAKSHYFKHDKAKEDFGYNVNISIEDGLKDLFKKEIQPSL